MVTTKELKNIAKERKLQNYHNLSKEDLSRMLKIPIFKTKRYYQNIAKDRNLKNYQNLKIADLVKLLNMNPEIPIPAKVLPEKPIPAKVLPEKPIPAKVLPEKPIPAKKSVLPEKPIPAKKSVLPERPIPAPRRNIQKVIPEKPIPAPRRNPPRIQKVIPEKPIPAPRRNPPTIQKVIPEKPIPAPRRNPPTIQKAIDTMLGWVDWFRESGKKITQPISSALNTLRTKINTLFEEKFEVRDGQSALSQFTREKIIDGKPGYDPKTFFQKTRNILIKIFKENQNTKMKMILICQMQKTDLTTGETIEIEADFHSDIEINIAEKDDKKLLDKMIARIEEVLANFQQSGSNWVFQEMQRLEIHFANWQPLGGSTFIPLPAKLKNKKGVINIKNEDNQCFKWCIARALNPVDQNSNRLTKELVKQSKRLNWNGLKFPVGLKAIKIFENNNPSISINVFGFEEEVYPLKIAKEKRINNIDLLWISDEKKQHYCLIKDLSKFLRSSLTKHSDAVEICRSCLNHFPKGKLKNHEEYCFQNETIKIEMPKEGSSISFKHHNRSIKVPFVVYADFEAFTKEIKTIPQNDRVAFTQKYQHHQPSGFCYKIVGQNIKRCVLFRATENEDVSRKFVEMLEEDIKKIFQQFNFSKKMVISPQEQKDFLNAEFCWICQKKFKKDEKKVRDHDHFTGKFRGAAHNKCNLQFKKPQFTPVIFHNLSGYDAHLFVKNLGVSEGNIKCIPNNEEKYISFSKEIVVDSWEKDGKTFDVKHEIRFLDSFKFMASSLSGLVDNLARSGMEKFQNLKKEFKENFELLTQKGVYPYDYMNCLEKFSETQLPIKEDFYSKLNDCNITDKEYKHAQDIWEKFGINNLGEYHDLYLKTDVLLLADVFEEFRNICLENYNLDPAWYYTSPGLSWDALLKHSKVNLELLTDPDMLLMFEKGIRGEISMISNRHGRANNKYMKEKFDSSQPSKFVPYLDANNLYGWAMMKSLPVGDFHWMTNEELWNWMEFPCVLEVDLEYPEELHDFHNDYPLAPERIKINKVEKLIPTLLKKEKYVLHRENLKLYLSLGLKLKWIHRGIKFREKPWMKSYIELNTDLRTKGKNDFEKDFFKLMNNSVFGKTMENIRNRVDVRLVGNREKAQKLIAKPNLKHWICFDENLIGIHLKRIKLVFNKPVYCGMSILDLSKTMIYDFHYNYIIPKFGKKQKLLFTDTDSLCYEIETEDFFADIAGDVKELFDTSNFDKNHPSEIQGKNKKVPGMMKDEAGGKIIEEFVGLRSKLYSYKMFEGKEEKKCKGIKKVVVKKQISFEDYKECLLSKQPQMRKMNVIRSHQHEIFSETVNKIALAADDDKRIILDDGISTLAFGNKNLPK